MDNLMDKTDDRFFGYIGEGVANESLQCKDCKHCIKDNVLECKIYSEKPSGVLNSGAECEDYEKK